MDVQDTEAIVHLLSKHPGNPGKYNESNPGLGIRLGLRDGYLGFGGYKNSLDKNSLYAGYGNTLGSLGPLSLGYNAGVISGYNDSIVPFLIPELKYRGNGWNALLNFIPPVKMGDKQVDPAIGLSFGIPFGERDRR